MPRAKPKPATENDFRTSLKRLTRKQAFEKAVEAIRLETPEGIQGELKKIIRDSDTSAADRLRACKELSNSLGFGQAEFAAVTRMTNEELAAAFHGMAPLIEMHLKLSVDFKKGRGVITIDSLEKEKAALEERILGLRESAEPETEEVAVEK